MPTYNYALAGGVNAVPGYGDRWKIGFIGNWAAADTWAINVVATTGDITWGVGELEALNPDVCFTYKNRVYLGLGSQFNFSDNGDPTAWEVQNPGAGFIIYLSEFGSQDTIKVFSQIQGRLAVFARRSVQLWTTDADPNNFSMIQTLDNIGTQAPLSVQNIGDYDVMFLDDTGFRSLRSKEVTLNAYVDDVGSPIDILTNVSAVGANAPTACGVVEPTTKTYWCAIGGTIYVLSRYPSSKVSAWSTFEPRGDDNVLFTPQKFVVYNGKVYCRSTQGGHYAYGGTGTAPTYDTVSQVTWQLPWTDDKRPDTKKLVTAIETVMQGKWTISVSTNPQDPTPFTNKVAYTGGSATVPSELTDSTYDTGRKVFSAQGTHFSVQGVSANQSTTVPAIFSAISIHYNLANIK